MFGIRVVPQNKEGLVETFGQYKHTVKSGLHFYLPLVQRIRIVSLALNPISLENYSIITKDNAEVIASLTLTYHVSNAERYVYENSDSLESMAQLVRGHLRDILGRLELNEVTSSTTAINQQLSEAIGDLNDQYGIKVDRVNIDQLNPSPEIQKAMDKQLTADRERVAAISKANGEAESIRLTNEAQNNALMATAKAQADATKTQADAEQYRINTVQEALANASDNYFKNQSINAYRDLANSETNTVVVPNENAEGYGQFSLLANKQK